MSNFNFSNCKIKKEDVSSSNKNKECPVCYTADNLEKKFACDHLICKDCFSNQLKTCMSINLKCPICNNEVFGEDIKDNEIHRFFALHFINCANKGIPVKIRTSNGEDIDLPLGDLVPNIISEQKANKLSDLFANNLSKR